MPLDYDGVVIVNDYRTDSPERNMEKDIALLDNYVHASPNTPVVRIWENEQCLVVSKAEARLPYFARAQNQMAAEGWPVIVRSTGGTVVPHDTGMVFITLIFTLPKNTTCLEKAYAAICGPLQTALRNFGVVTLCGRVASSFCDGKYNIVANGRKIAGTSQYWKDATNNRRVILAHACILVDANRKIITEAANRFYELAGGTVRFNEDALINVSECLEYGECPSANNRPGEFVGRFRKELISVFSSVGADLLQYENRDSSCSNALVEPRSQTAL